MSADHAALSHHPAPHRDRVALWMAGFGVIGGPLAWFVELCGGYALATAPCFNAAGTRRLLPEFAWTWPALLTLLVLCVFVALAAFTVSYRSFARTREESGGDPRHLMEAGSGRTRFLALWGMLLGAGFAVVTALTAVGFALLPRCAG